LNQNHEQQYYDVEEWNKYHEQQYYDVEDNADTYEINNKHDLI